MTMKLTWLRGCATALVTPFRIDSSIDETCFRALVERQLNNDVKLLVPCGTTGESATMTVEEDLHVIQITIDVAKKRGAKVIAGTGSNDTREAISYTLNAKEAGAHAALIVAPYYNKPTQEGMFAHFAAIAVAAGPFPIVLYNVPSRTGSNISAATCLRLANEFENIVGIKEASGDLSQIMKIISDRPANFKVFAGDDASALPLIAAGADGLVSVCANELPMETAMMVEAALDGDVEIARQMHIQLLQLIEGNFLETSPAPCKFVMAEMGLLEECLRLPLVPVGAETRRKLRNILIETLTFDTQRAGTC